MWVDTSIIYAVFPDTARIEIVAALNDYATLLRDRNTRHEDIGFGTLCAADKTDYSAIQTALNDSLILRTHFFGTYNFDFNVDLRNENGFHSVLFDSEFGQDAAQKALSHLRTKAEGLLPALIAKTQAEIETITRQIEAQTPAVQRTRRASTVFREGMKLFNTALESEKSSRSNTPTPSDDSSMSAAQVALANLHTNLANATRKLDRLTSYMPGAQAAAAPSRKTLQRRSTSPTTMFGRVMSFSPIVTETKRTPANSRSSSPANVANTSSAPSTPRDVLPTFVGRFKPGQ